MIKQSALVFDIETSEMKVTTFGIRDQYIGDDQIIEDSRVLAISAKWLGDPASAVMYREARTAGRERALLLWIRGLLDKTDIVVTQNGKAFDCKFLTARFMVHNIVPPSPYKHIDTLLFARSVAKFPSNKLSYLTKTLCVKYKKRPHSKFPGRSLWAGCAAGNPSAWSEMKKYNIYDVLSTEELYMKLRAWAPVSAPPVYIGDLSKCGTCGSGNVRPRGHQYSRLSRRPQIVCRSCFKWTFGDREAL